MGRPTKVNEFVSGEVENLLESGVPIKTIGKRLKIGIGTIYKIMKEKNIKSKNPSGKKILNAPDAYKVQ
jgi:hypothetical protein